MIWIDLGYPHFWKFPYSSQDTEPVNCIFSIRSVGDHHHGPMNQRRSVGIFHRFVWPPLCYQTLWLVGTCWNNHPWNDPDSFVFSAWWLRAKFREKRWVGLKLSGKVDFFKITHQRYPKIPKCRQTSISPSGATVTPGSRFLDQGATDSRGVGALKLGGVLHDGAPQL